MTFDEFVKKYLGKGIDYDGNGKYWCVDLYRQYCKEVLNIPQSPLVQGAFNIWETYLKEYFDPISNTPQGVPIKGDIVIWNKNVGGGYGHVGIFIEGNASKFKSFDQNWPVGSLCKIVDHQYTNVIGWLKSKEKNTISDDLAECLKQHANLLNQLKQKDEEIAKIKEVRDDYQNKWKISEVEAEQEKRLFKEFRQELATKLGCGQNPPEILGQIEGLIRKEDNIDKVKRDFDTYKNGVLKNLEKLGGVLGALPDFPALLEALVALKATSKAQDKEITTLKTEIVKNDEIIKRYKTIIEKKEKGLFQRISEIINSFLKF